MAEFVQQSIEEMLPELEQMKRVDLFTEKETRTILRKRKAYEYKLRRRTKQKEDYLQYIQYEMHVLALVKKRRKSTGYHFKQMEIDLAIINRIHKIFKLSCWRFQEDINLWLSHIDFCKRRKEKAPVGNLYLRMLQIHNKKPALWVLAAQWEMEETGSMENARSLLQRGIRFNNTSQHLWQEYFRMELLNADKLRKRRKILGLASLAQEEAEMSDHVLEGKVAEIVLKKALETIPDDVAFCLSFLPIVRLFDFATHIEEELFAVLKIQYCGDELTWEALATQKIQSSKPDKSLPRKQRDAIKWEQECQAATIFDNAVQEVNTEKMWGLYINFCMAQMKKKSTKSLCDMRASKLLTVFQKACKASKLTAELYNTWVEILVSLGVVLEVSDVLDQGLTHHPTSVLLWVTRLRIAMVNDAQLQDVQTLVNKALKIIPEKVSYPVWEITLSWAKKHQHPEYAESLFERGVLLCREVSVPLKIDYLDWAMVQHGISLVRTVYHQLSASQPLSVEFFQTYINIEMNQPEPKIKKLRHGFEDAIREYGSSSTDLWLDYIKLENTHPKGQAQGAGQIHWRASRTLQPELMETFVTKFTLLQTGHL